MFEEANQGRAASVSVSFSDTGRSVAQIDKNLLKAPD
jgi:hypothetical protein